jgi:type IV pilus assembly protein PilW
MFHDHPLPQLFSPRRGLLGGPRRLQAGMSLIEVMIAMAIGLFLLLGLTSVFVTSNQTYVDLSRASPQIENGRFAVQIIGDDVALAGHYGRFSGQIVLPGSLPDMPHHRDRPAGGGRFDSEYDAPRARRSHRASRIRITWRAPTSLVVRRADRRPPPKSLTRRRSAAGERGPTNSTIRSSCAGTAAITLLNKDATTLSPIRKFHVRIYFVAPCSIPNGGGSTTGSADDGGSRPHLEAAQLGWTARTRSRSTSFRWSKGSRTSRWTTGSTATRTACRTAPTPATPAA